MKRRVLFVSAIAIASAAAGAVPAQTYQGVREWNVTVRLKAYKDPIRLDTIVTWYDVLGAPAVAHGALRAAVDSLRIPLLIADSARGLLHHPGFTVRSSLAGKPMNQWWHCGHGMSGDYADTYRMTIAYAILVEPTTDGYSRVGVGFVAGAQSLEGVSTEPLACGTTGALEQRILKLTHLEILKK